MSELDNCKADGITLITCCKNLKLSDVINQPLDAQKQFISKIHILFTNYLVP